jgi:hypothetical protein
MGEIEYYIHAVANNVKEQYRPNTALEGGVNTFIYNLDQCDDPQCVANVDSNCNYSAMWNPICGCDNVTYSNSGAAFCNNIFSWTEGPCNDDVNLLYRDASNQQIIMVVDLMGREVYEIEDNQIVFVIFSDGFVKKVFNKLN